MIFSIMRAARAFRSMPDMPKQLREQQAEIRHLRHALMSLRSSLRATQADVDQSFECISELSGELAFLDPGWAGFDAPEDFEPGGRYYTPDASDGAAP